jgi:hypothetical protein
VGIIDIGVQVNQAVIQLVERLIILISNNESGWLFTSGGASVHLVTNVIVAALVFGLDSNATIIGFVLLLNQGQQ